MCECQNTRTETDVFLCAGEAEKAVKRGKKRRHAAAEEDPAQQLPCLEEPAAAATITRPDGSAADAPASGSAAANKAADDADAGGISVPVQDGAKALPIAVVAARAEDGGPLPDFKRWKSEVQQAVAAAQRAGIAALQGPSPQATEEKSDVVMLDAAVAAGDAAGPSSEAARPAKRPRVLRSRELPREASALPLQQRKQAFPQRRIVQQPGSCGAVAAAVHSKQPGSGQQVPLTEPLKVFVEDVLKQNGLPHEWEDISRQVDILKAEKESIERWLEEQALAGISSPQPALQQQPPLQQLPAASSQQPSLQVPPPPTTQQQQLPENCGDALPSIQQRPSERMPPLASQEQPWHQVCHSCYSIKFLQSVHHIP